jgi:hypothetical protein
MKAWFWLLLAGSTILLYQNCSARHEMGGEAIGSNNFNMALSLQAYETTFFPLVSSNESCASCHGVSITPLHALPDPSAAHDITISFGLIDFFNPGNSRIVQKIRNGHNGFPASFADEMEAAIQNWADEYVALGGQLGTTPGDLGPSFASIKEFILDTRCVLCHNPSGAYPSIDYTDYLTTINTGRVVPGNADASALYTSCVSGSMPQGGPPLTAEELEAIRTWINDGALNN